MEIYLLRHATAQAPGSLPDAERPLTADGREDLLRVLDRARSASVAPTLIVASPLKRALETAALAAEVLSYPGRIVSSQALLSEATPEALWEEMCKHQGENAILAVGHEPHLSMCAAYLLGASALKIDMKQAGLVRIDVARFSGEPQGVLKWMITPAVAG